jgi:hypothetical protein
MRKPNAKERFPLQCPRTDPVCGGTPSINKIVTTMIVDISILLALVAISIGFWFYPWVTLLVLALVLFGGCIFGQDSG